MLRESEKMNPDIKKKFTEALRSGDYIQGQGALRRPKMDGTYEWCCLGVLCDLHQKAVGEKTWTATGYYNELSALPPVVGQWAGLSSANPIIRETNLIRMNDMTKLSFNSIADLIDTYL